MMKEVSLLSGNENSESASQDEMNKRNEQVQQSASFDPTAAPCVSDALNNKEVILH